MNDLLCNVQVTAPASHGSKVHAILNFEQMHEVINFFLGKLGSKEDRIRQSNSDLLLRSGHCQIQNKNIYRRLFQ